MKNTDNTTLFDLTGNLLRLYEMMDDPDIEPDVLIDTMEAVEGEFEAKAEGYASVMVKLTGDMEMIMAQEKRLYSRRKAIENNIKRMKEHLQESMEITGKTKFKTTLWSFGIQNNPASLVLDTDNVDSLPSSYIKVTKDFDKAAIKEAIKNGVNFNGIAHLEQTQSLRIR